MQLLHRKIEYSGRSNLAITISALEIGGLCAGTEAPRIKIPMNARPRAVTGVVRIALLLLALCLSFAPAARADWADDVEQIKKFAAAGDYIAAEQAASVSLKAGPSGLLFSGTGTLIIHHWRGRLRLLLGETGGAIEDADAIINADSSFFPPDAGYDLRAMAKVLGGDAHGAQADFEAALESAKAGDLSRLRTYSIYGDRAIARLLMSDLAGAEADLTVAINGDYDTSQLANFVKAKKDSLTKLRAAIAKLNVGDVNSARALAQTAVNISRKSDGTAETSEFVAPQLWVAQLTRKESAQATAQIAPPAAPEPTLTNDSALLALQQSGPKQTSYWGIVTADAEGGAAVKIVAADSAAAAAGLRVDDVLVSVNGVPMRNAKDWLEKREHFPLYTPLRLVILRNGSQVETQITVPGRVRLTVAPIDPVFAIPGVPPPPTETMSPVEALDAFNVLEQIILDPKSGKIAVIGRYDRNFNTGPIPYLDLLKTALAYPTPRLNIWPTPETARLLEKLAPEIAAKLRKFPFNEMIAFVQGRPDLERDRQLMIRELARSYGLTPEQYAAWYNFTRLDVQSAGNSEVFPPPPVRAIEIKAFGTLGYGNAASALSLIYQQSENAAAQALGVLGRADEAAAIQAQGGKDALGAMTVAAYLAIAQQTQMIPPTVVNELRNEYEAKRTPWQNVVKAAESFMPYMEKNGKVDLMRHAFDRIVLSSPAGLLAFPKLQQGRSYIEPIDLDASSQLARIMYEADYTFKSIEARPELFERIPGFITSSELKARSVLAGNDLEDAPKSSRIWIEPLAADMTVSPGRNVVNFTTVRMNVRAADATEIINAHATDRGKPGPYVDWTAKHIMDHFDEYARIVPAFHKVREAAKVIALAQWLRSEQLSVDLSDVAQTKWKMPDSFPMLSLISQSYVIHPDGRMRAESKLITDGGVSFRPKGRQNWTSMTPAPQSETKASDQLVLSAGLGQKALRAAKDGDLEQARYLAELSAQAMNGSVSKAGLAKLNIVVPDAKALAVAPATVALQKEIVRKIYQQVEALKQNPDSRAAVGVALGQLESVYSGVRLNPISASDFLLKLQAGQLAAAPAAVPVSKIPPVPVPKAAGISPSPASKTADAPLPAANACTAKLSPTEIVPGEHADYINNKLAEARNRLRYINEALKKLIELNVKQRAEIDKLTADITKDYEVATERAYDFAVSTLVDLPLAKYVDIHNTKAKELENLIKGQNLLRTVPMSDSALKAIEYDITQMTALKDQYNDSFVATKRMLDLYAGAGYGRDIYKWDEDTRTAGDRKRGYEATLLGGKILLDLPWLEDKFLSKMDWFGGNKMWQLMAAGKMAGYATGFFFDVLDLYGAWGPLAANLREGLQINTEAMQKLRLKAQRTMQEINCLEKFVQK